MRERWAAELADRARAHWTPERTRALAGDKQLAILPADSPHLLRALGLMNSDATIPPARVHKFLQINHLVRVLDPEIAALRAHHPTIRIVDAGCGRSYLTLLIAHVARTRWQHPIEILGVDRNPAIIDECRRRAELAELSDLAAFRVASLDSLHDPAHAVFALHACDTATDDAIAFGVAARADLIAVAPCCQAELARAWSALAETGGAFAPIWRSGHFSREIAAHVTDAMRTVLLRGAGYTVVAQEFIAMEHTKKNTLLRASRGDPDPRARAEYDALVASTGGAGIALASRI